MQCFDRNYLLITLVLLFSCLFSCHKASDEATALSHEQWTNLLQLYVSEEGLVDYNGFVQDTAALKEYTQFLVNNLPDSTWAYSDSLSYWLNVYNAFTVKLVVENYPLTSILSINDGEAWQLPFISLGDSLYTLDFVEHGVLRVHFNEPRIHFAVNCASKSCPILLNEAYEANTLSTQLARQTQLFINDSTKNVFTTDTLYLSQLFNWFLEDFTENGTLIDYLNDYTSFVINDSAVIDYLYYDWSLNE